MSDHYLTVTSPTSASLAPTKMNVPVVGDAAPTVPSLTFRLPVTVPDSSTTTVLYAPCDLKIVDVEIIKTTATGSSANDKITVKDVSANACTDAIAVGAGGPGVLVGAVKRASKIILAYNSFAKGATINVVSAKTGSVAANLWLVCEPV